MADKLKITYRAPSSLTPYRRNARTHSAEQVAQIARSIQEFGWTNPILVDEAGGIIAGHGRLAAALELGLDRVPTICVAGLTETQVRALVIADNKLALNAGWDADILGSEIEALTLGDFDLSLLGFSDEDLQAMTPLQIEPGLTDPDDAPAVQAEAVTKPGDVWLLGRHRVMCGDSTSIDAVEALTAGQPVDMVFTDPPYGISHSGKGITANGVAGNDFGEILGDADTAAAVDAFVMASGLFPGATLIFWGANYYASALPNGFGWLVWDKEREGDTFSGAELAFVNKGVRLDVFRHRWHGMVKASEHGQKRLHPTQKPIALAEWCFEHYGEPASVLDLFGGSGSTLIACEKTGRHACLMELDPRYCDVILRRWQAFTGKQATLEADGRTFDEVAAKVAPEMEPA